MNQAQPQPPLALPPTRLPLLSIGATILVLFLVIFGGISLLWLQQPLRQQTTDTRTEASVDNGSVLLATSPTPGATLAAKQPAKIDVTINTQGQVAKEVSLVFHVLSSTMDELSLQTYSTYNFEVTQQEIEATSDGFLVLYKARPTNNGTFSSTSPSPVLSLLFTPDSVGPIKLSFDTEKSRVLKVDNSPVDILRTVGTLEYTVSDNPSHQARTCNQSCSANNQCAVNHMCYEGRCRLITNVSSESCAAPATSEAGLACNQTCSTTSQCKTGLTCVENHCRRPENPDSSSCSVASASQLQAMATTCNQSCNNNSECGVNLRCVNSRCRLASNPSSTSCSATTAPTISSQYDQSTKGGIDMTATQSATVSGILEPEENTPTPSALPTVSAENTAPSSTSNNSLINRLNTLLANWGVPTGRLLIIAAIVGLGLLLLTLIAKILRRRGGSSSAAVKNTPKGAAYEQELQEKINQLKQQSTAAPGQPVSGASATVPTNLARPPQTLTPAPTTPSTSTPMTAPQPVATPAPVQPTVQPPVQPPDEDLRPPTPTLQTQVPTPEWTKPLPKADHYTVATPTPQTASTMIAPPPVIPTVVRNRPTVSSTSTRPPIAQPMPVRPVGQLRPAAPQSSLPAAPVQPTLPSSPPTPALPTAPAEPKLLAKAVAATQTMPLATPAMPIKPATPSHTPGAPPVTAAASQSPTQTSSSMPGSRPPASSMMNRLKHRGVTLPQTSSPQTKAT